jgi:hypothetical protein
MPPRAESALFSVGMVPLVTLTPLLPKLVVLLLAADAGGDATGAAAGGSAEP